MKKKIIIIITLLIIIALISLFICYKQGYIFDENEAEKTEFTYMPPTYEICDTDSCIYLLGSIHIGDNKVTNFNKIILDYYNKSNYLAVELDIQNVDIMSSATDYLLDFGETLDDLITPELKEKLENFLKSHNSDYSYELLIMFKLGFINSFISLMATTELNMIESGVDDYFLTLAHNENKEIIELETYEEQMDLLLNYSDELYITQIENSIDNYDMMVETLQLLYTAYINEDKETLKELLSEDTSTDEVSELEKEYTKAMYDDRNIRMAENIEKFLSENKEVFMVVGAAHVIGENGIIDLLQDRNYTITEVK